MGFPVYDFRNPEHITNMLVTPQIRSRFLRMEPGTSATMHTHDLGQEIFLVLQGKCEFTIDGEKEVLEPGQLCVALVDQAHVVRVVGDEPMVMYLSVTPHVHPTHTYWDDEGNRLPYRYGPNSNYDVQDDDSIGVSELLGRQAQRSAAVAEAAATLAEVNAKALEAEAFDGPVREGMWEALRNLHLKVAEMDDNWNALAPRADA